MYQSVPEDLLDFIKNHQTFLIAGHKEPDGDCVGSQLALESLLKRLGKEALSVSAGPFDRPEIRKFQDRFVPIPDLSHSPALIVVDCAGLDRTGDLEKPLSIIPRERRALLDHHRSGGHWDGVAYWDSAAPSTTALATRLIEALGLIPTPEEAELLFLGLCTDTGFFRHVDGEGAETFALATRLIEAGANPKESYRLMYAGKTHDSRILLGRILARSTLHYDGALIISHETLEESRQFGKGGRDSDTLYQLLQAVEGVEAIVVIRQESEERCTIGFRSLDRVDVSQAAQAFGGGGHKNAAGATYPGTIAEIEPRIIEVFAHPPVALKGGSAPPFPPPPGPALDPLFLLSPSSPLLRG